MMMRIMALLDLLLLLLLDQGVVAAAAAAGAAAGAAAAAVLHMLLRSTRGCSRLAVLSCYLMWRHCALHWKTGQVGGLQVMVILNILWDCYMLQQPQIGMPFYCDCGVPKHLLHRLDMQGHRAVCFTAAGPCIPA
jgi:hypothetical protein